ncbi:hypothetical protein BJV77DRAFT_563409 [Russula vinacea]|nr:hypothetical protein BJV77DRAFT_563409 [Russula vinacea]
MSPLCQCPNFHLYKLSGHSLKKNPFELFSPRPRLGGSVHIVCLRSFLSFCSTRGSGRRTSHQTECRASRVPTLFTNLFSSFFNLSPPELTRASHALHHAPLRDGMIQDLVLLGRALWLDRVPAEMRLSFLGIPRLVSRMVLRPQRRRSIRRDSQLRGGRPSHREGQTVCDIWHIC